MSTKAIRIGLEHYDTFQTMTPGKVKKIILGLMDFASGRCATGMNKEIYPTFEKLREQLGEEGEGNHDDHNEEHERGFDMILEAFEKKRRYYEEKLVKPDGEMKELEKMLENPGKMMKAHESMEKFVVIMVEELANLEGVCNVLKEENAMLKDMRKTPKYGNYVERVLKSVEGRLERHSKPCADATSDIVEREDANGGGCVVSHEGVVLTKEVWKVVDENWEQLKDAVRKMKVKKEELHDVDLPVEAWDVLDHHFDELVRLFHL